MRRGKGKGDGKWPTEDVIAKSWRMRESGRGFIPPSRAMISETTKVIKETLAQCLSSFVRSLQELDNIATKTIVAMIVFL